MEGWANGAIHGLANRQFDIAMPVWRGRVSIRRAFSPLAIRCSISWGEAQAGMETRRWRYRNIITSLYFKAQTLEH